MTTVAEGERTSFLHLVEEPHRGQASLYYCLPLWDGADQSIRRFISYPISAPAWSPGERPFWVDLSTRPLAGDFARDPYPHITIGAHYGTRTPPDRLIFVVDRNVELGDPHPRSVSMGTTRDGTPYRIRPEVAFRRIQHRPGIPQSSGGDFGFLSPSIVARRRIGASVSAPERIIEVNRDVYPFSQVERRPGQDAAALGRLLGLLELVVIESPRTDGGVLISVILKWRYRNREEAADGFQDVIVAEIELAVEDPHQPAAWFYEVGRRRVGNRFPIRFSYLAANLRVTVRTRLGIVDSVLRGWSILQQARREVLHTAPPRIPYVDLRFRRDGPQVVPRPEAELTSQTFPFSNPEQAAAGLRIEPLEDDTVARIMLDVLIGFIPVIGDLVDIGEFVLALATGRDRWGEQVSSFELFLMGVGAVAPLVSSRSLRLVGRARDIFEGAGRTVRNSWGSAEDFVGHFRPALLRRLQEARSLQRFARGRGRDALALEQLAQFVQQGVTEADLRFALTTSEHVAMTGVRDLELARLLGLIR